MNKNELKAVMVRYGDTQDSLAKAIGISRQRLSLKINEKNGAVFTQPEMTAIKERYSLDGTAMMNIFFANEVS